MIDVQALGLNGVYRIDDTGRIRFIHRPTNDVKDERVILIGNFNKNKGFLLLNKSKPDWGRKSFSLGIPVELWNLWKDEINSVCILERQTSTVLMASKKLIETIGYQDEVQLNRQAYLYLDFEHWTQHSDLEDAVIANDIKLSKNKTLKGEYNEKNY